MTLKSVNGRVKTCQRAASCRRRAVALLGVRGFCLALAGEAWGLYFWSPMSLAVIVAILAAMGSEGDNDGRNRNARREG